MKLISLPALTLVMLFAVTAPVHADDDRLTITISKPLPKPEDATIFSTHIDVTKDETKTKSISEIVDETPGVRVTSQSIGGFASASIRGQSPNQTLVLLDGIPLNGILYGVADLNDIPRAIVGSIDISKGFVPASYAAMASGGVISVTTVDPPPYPTGGGSVGFGSFGSWEASVNGSAARGGLSAVGIASYRTTTGDFTYFNDNGTPYNTSDDSIEKRIDNDLTQTSVFVKGAYRTGRTRAECALTYVRRFGGVPSLGYIRATDPRFVKDDLSVVATVHGRTSAFSDVELRAFARDDLANFTDLGGELGLGRNDSTTTTISTGGSLRITTRKIARQLLSVVINGSHDSTGADDRLALTHADGIRMLLSAALSDEIGLMDGRLKIVPVATGERTSYAYDPGTTFSTVYGTLSDRAYSLFAPKLGLSYAPGGGIVLKANIGRSSRAPALGEIFGDAGFTVPNLKLTTEDSLVGDIGLSGSLYAGTARIGYDFDSFASSSENLIIFVKNSQVTSKATNIASSRTLGAEAGVVVESLSGLSVSSSYTYLDALDTGPIVVWRGKNLPGRPKHKAEFTIGYRFAVRGVLLRPYYELAYYGMNYLDRANTVVVDARLVHSIGLSAQQGERFRLSVDLKNLTSNQISDYMGFPEPGFNSWIELAVKL